MQAADKEKTITQNKLWLLNIVTTTINAEVI